MSWGCSSCGKKINKCKCKCKCKWKKIMLKIAIVGSRKYENYDKFKILLSRVFQQDHIGEWQLISGGARGVDSMADKFYKSCVTTSLPPIIIMPDYEKYHQCPKIAPLMRNREIARECNLMIAFWDGLSGGTANAIAWATFYNKKVLVFDV